MDGQTLKQQLWTAIDQNDNTTFRALCNKYRVDIEKYFLEDWRYVSKGEGEDFVLT